MKQLLPALALALLMIACTTNPSETKKDDSTSTAAKTPDIVFPYKATYSSAFEPGDQKNAKMVLDMWKEFEENRLGDSRNSWADTVTFFFGDGSKFSGPRDSLISATQAYRSSFSSCIDSIDAWIPVHSTDRNEDWVLVWGHEYKTDKKGKKDTADLHELWQIKNGKVPLVFQYQVHRN